MVSAEKRELFTDAGRVKVHAVAGQAALYAASGHTISMLFKVARHDGAPVTG